MENNRKLDEINYQPLQNMDQVWFGAIRDTFKLPPAVSISALVIISLVLMFLHPYAVTVFFLFIYGVMSGKVLSRKANIWKDFAAANGWYVITSNVQGLKYVPPGLSGTVKLIESRILRDVNYIPPCLLGLGRRPQMSDIVHATFEGHECDVFLYQFITGSGKHQQTHYYTVAKVALAKPFPHIILDSKSTWSLTQRGDATDTTKLEGNFSKNFSLHYSKNDHINALSIVTPDIMQTLIDNNRAQDIEIIDDKLFFISGYDKRTPEALKSVFKSVDALADQIKHKAKTLRYTPVMTANERAIYHAALQQSKSTDRVMAYIVMAFFIIFVIPFIVIIGLGIFFQIQGT